MKLVNKLSVLYRDQKIGELTMTHDNRCCAFEPKASISGYINNIVNEHLEKCKPEIIKLYKEKKADYGN